MGKIDLIPHTFRIDSRGRTYVDENTLIRVHPRITSVRGPRQLEKVDHLRAALKLMQGKLLRQMQLSRMRVASRDGELLVVYGAYLYECACLVKLPVIYYDPAVVHDDTEIDELLELELYEVPLLHALNSHRDEVLRVQATARSNGVVLTVDGDQLPIRELRHKYLASFLAIGRSGVSMGLTRLTRRAVETRSKGESSTASESTAVPKATVKVKGGAVPAGDTGVKKNRDATVPMQRAAAPRNDEAAVHPSTGVGADPLDGDGPKPPLEPSLPATPQHPEPAPPLPEPAAAHGSAGLCEQLTLGPEATYRPRQHRKNTRAKKAEDQSDSPTPAPPQLPF